MLKRKPGHLKKGILLFQKFELEDKMDRILLRFYEQLMLVLLYYILYTACVLTLKSERIDCILIWYRPYYHKVRIMKVGHILSAFHYMQMIVK